MAKVNINGLGHQVEIESDEALASVVRVAKKLWADTAPDDRAAGPAFGFTSHPGQGRDGFEWRVGQGHQPNVRGDGEAR